MSLRGRSCIIRLRWLAAFVALGGLVLGLARGGAEWIIFGVAAFLWVILGLEVNRVE
jgi:hypothetical protein